MTALAVGLALLLPGCSMPSDPEGSLPPLSGTSGNLWGALAIDSNQGLSWGWAVDYETVQAATQSALARCCAISILSLPVSHGSAVGRCTRAYAPCVSLSCGR